MSWRWVPVSGAYTTSALEAAGLTRAFDDQAAADFDQPAQASLIKTDGRFVHAGDCRGRPAGFRSPPW